LSRFKGKKAEDLACDYLEKLGFKIVERNFYSKFGEIDIVAIKDDILHFIEVKSGKGFEPIYNITTKKIEKLLLAIDYFLMKKNLNITYQIDAIIIKDGNIEFIENVTIY